MKSIVLVYAVGMSLIVGLVAYERMLWNECRAQNSWFYCARVLGH